MMKTRILGITEGGKPFEPLREGDLVIDQDGETLRFQRYSSTGWFGHFEYRGAPIKLPLAGLQLANAGQEAAE